MERQGALHTLCLGGQTRATAALLATGIRLRALRRY